jgi:hypothetical protein
MGHVTNTDGEVPFKGIEPEDTVVDWDALKGGCDENDDTE